MVKSGQHNYYYMDTVNPIDVFLRLHSSNRNQFCVFTKVRASTMLNIARRKLEDIPVKYVILLSDMFKIAPSKVLNSLIKIEDDIEKGEYQNFRDKYKNGR